MNIQYENKNLIGQQNTFIINDNKTIGIYSWYGFDYIEIPKDFQGICFKKTAEENIKDLKQLKQMIEVTIQEYEKLYTKSEEE